MRASVMRRASPAGRPRRRAVVLGLALLAGTACSEPVPPDPAASRQDEPAAAVTFPEDQGKVRLVLVTARDYEDTLGYRHVEGRLTNPSEHALQDARVVVTWYTDWEDLVTTREGGLEPVPAGETVSFDVAGPAIPFASKFSVVFTQADGTPIPTEHRP